MPLKLGVIQIQKDKEGSNLIEIILGSIIGTVVSLIIAEMYHRRSSRGLKREIDLLEQTNKKLLKTLDDVIDNQDFIAEKTEIIHNHSVRGTPDDPDYPYK